MNAIASMRNIGISAHIDSGKTTLTERILYYAGKIHKIEEVRGGGSGATMDHMELEKERGITITSAATTVFWKDKQINIIDTPGHVDFTVEVERSLRVLDGAILVLCSVGGVQSQSITVDRQMKRYKVPRLVFINKMDRTGADPYKGVAELREKLKLNPVLMQIPVGLEDKHEGVVDLITMKAFFNDGERGETVREEEIPEHLVSQAKEQREFMLEELANFSDELMERVLEGEDVTEDMIHNAVKAGVMSLEMVPVFLGSAFKNKGVQKLLDAVDRYLPSPISAAPPMVTDLDTNERKELKPDPDEPMVAMAFKITDEQFGQGYLYAHLPGYARKGTHRLQYPYRKKDAGRASGTHALRSQGEYRFRKCRRYYCHGWCGLRFRRYLLRGKHQCRLRIYLRTRSGDFPGGSSQGQRRLHQDGQGAQPVYEGRSNLPRFRRSRVSRYHYCRYG